MNQKKNISLSAKITVQIAIILFVIFFILLFMITYITKSDRIFAIALLYMVGLFILCISSYLIIRKHLKPLKQMEAAVLELTNGNLQIPVPCSSNDEFDDLAKSYNQSIETIYGYVMDINHAMEEMARGNFDVYPRKPFIGDFSEFENSITNFIKNICNTLKKIDLVAELVSSEAEQVASNSTSLSAGAAEQAASIEQLAASILLLSEKVETNNVNAKSAGAKVTQAGDYLTVSNTHMAEMLGAMDEITNNSSEIGKIIKTIEDIAFQTNILALNAAVEAARAGSAGNGFAVVADEVRNLAGKSAEAARSTTAMIEHTISSVKTGASVAHDAAASLTAVSQKASEVMAIVSEISDASEVQMLQIEQIAENSANISAVVQNNSAAAQESAASSEELASQAQTLKRYLNHFQFNKVLTDS